MEAGVTLDANKVATRGEEDHSRGIREGFEADCTLLGDGDEEAARQGLDGGKIRRDLLRRHH